MNEWNDMLLEAGDALMEGLIIFGPIVAVLSVVLFWMVLAT